MASSLGSLFKTVIEISQLAVLENFDEALRACFFSAANKDSLSNHAEFEGAILCLKIVN
jgi:hypothetical protein